MKKYLILALSSVLVIIAVLWGYAAFNGLYGTWINVNPQPGNIFDGNVKIEKSKTNKGRSRNILRFCLIGRTTPCHALRLKGRRMFCCVCRF